MSLPDYKLFWKHKDQSSSNTKVSPVSLRCCYLNSGTYLSLNKLFPKFQNSPAIMLMKALVSEDSQ